MKPYGILYAAVFLLHTTLSLHSQEKPRYRPPEFPQDDRLERVVQLKESLHNIFLEQSARSRIPGIAYGVVVDDSLVLASACGLANIEQNIPASVHTPFRIASMSKSFTAMAILKLRDDGMLSLEDSAHSYLPEMASLVPPTSDSPPILVKNLMTMTAGFPEDNPWGDRQLDENDQMLSHLVSSGLSFSNPPGITYEYSNTGYAMLGLIISRVSGMPYQEYIRKNIFLPLGMEHTDFEYANLPEAELAMGYGIEDGEWKRETLLHDGAFGAMGGIITNIEDFSRYVAFHLQAWPPRDDPQDNAAKEPLRRSTLREMHMATFPRLDSRATDRSGKPCARMSGYGYGLRIDQYCDGLHTLSHGGALPGFGSKFYLLPEYGLGVMAFGNRTYTGPLPFDRICSLLLDSAELRPRFLPPNELLVSYRFRIHEMLRSWVSEARGGAATLSSEAENELVAENLFQDRSREKRMKEFAELFDRAGEIQDVEEVVPENQLRGSYIIRAEKGTLAIEFSLSPEAKPKLQYLEGSYNPQRP